MSTDSLPMAQTDFRDQRVGLIIFGVFQILIGCICGLMAPMMLLSVMFNASNMPPEQQLNAGMMVPIVALYALLAVVFVSLGVGSILARRWAWSLTVVLSWLWLLAGVIGMIFMLFCMPKMWSTMPEQAKIPSSALLAVQLFTMAIMAFIYILLPGVFLIFYQRASVWETCRRRDPKVRWTERCPLPVLALTLVLGYSTVWMPMSILHGGVVPFFGVLLTGAAGAVVFLASAIVLGFLTWGTYRLKMAAWWGTLLFWIFWVASATITFSRIDMTTLYEKMGYTPQQLEMVRRSGILDGNLFFAMSTVCGVALLGFLIWVRRYFVAEGK